MEDLVNLKTCKAAQCSYTVRTDVMIVLQDLEGGNSTKGRMQSRFLPLVQLSSAA